MLANNADSTASNAQVSQQDTTTIVNNIKTVAESGTSTVFGNTNGGDAVTGDALSNVVIFNVSGHEIIAKNSLLVFVNVLGKWVGMIVDAPPNATAAMIGNGVTTNAAYVPDLTINSQVNHGITNTIAVTAQSGDATVEYNTNAGNAVSGQARALANVANISGSQFGVSDWFGVLFINVFQNWYGSFGVDTAYGNIAKEEGRSGAAPIVFVPSAPEGGSRAEAGSRAGRTTTTLQTQSFGGSGTAQTLDIEEGATVLAQSTSKDVKAISSRNGPVEAVVRDGSEPYDYRLLIIAGSMLTIGLAVLGLRRMLHT